MIFTPVNQPILSLRFCSMTPYLPSCLLIHVSKNIELEDTLWAPHLHSLFHIPLKEEKSLHPTLLFIVKPLVFQDAPRGALRLLRNIHPHLCITCVMRSCHFSLKMLLTQALSSPLPPFSAHIWTPVMQLWPPELHLSTFLMLLQTWLQHWFITDIFLLRIFFS